MYDMLSYMLYISTLADQVMVGKRLNAFSKEPLEQKPFDSVKTS